jgi:uncharacterized membrane protein
MKKNDLRFVLFSCAVALVLRLFRIDSQSLWIDEILTLKMSDPQPGLNIWDYARFNIHGPLHAFVVYLFRFISFNDGWLRVPSAIAGAAAVYYFYRWIGIWLGTRIARFATLLLVFHPLHIYYSQELRNYSFLFFFATFSSYYLHRLLGRRSRRDYVLYVLAIAGAALSNFSAAFLFVVHTVLYVVRKGSGAKRVARWVLVSIAILVLISPWVYRIYTYIDVGALVTPVMPGQISTTERLRGETTVSAAAIPFAIYSFSAGFSLGPSLRELHGDASMPSVIRGHFGTVLWVAVLFGSLAVRGLVCAVRRRLPWVSVLLYLLMPMALTMLLSWQNAKVFNVRYVLVALPAYLSLVAIGLASLRTRWAALLSAAVVVTLAVSSVNYYYNGRYARENVRQAVRDLESRIGPEECIFVPSVREVVEYYFRKPNPVYAVFAPPGTSQERIDAQLDKLFANCDAFWYVRAREWVDDPGGRFLPALRERYSEMEVIEYEGVAVYHFARSLPRQ